MKKLYLLIQKYIQTILLILGLVLFDFGVLALFNVGAFLIVVGLSLIFLAFIILREKGGKI